MGFIRNLLFTCLGAAASASASAGDAPIGVPEDMLLPLKIRGYELHVVNGMNQSMSAMIEGRKLEIKIPIYVYLPSESVTAQRDHVLGEAKSVLVPLIAQPSVDSMKILPVVTKLQALIVGELEGASSPAATVSSDSDEGSVDGEPPKRIGDYSLNVLNREKPAKVSIGLSTREILLPVYFYLPDPNADTRFVASVRQVAGTLARLARENSISGEDLGVAVLAIDRILSSSADFRRDHQPVRQLSPGEEGVTVTKAAAPIQPSIHRDEPNVSEPASP